MTTRRSLASEVIAGAILGLFAGLGVVVVIAGAIHILEGIDRTFTAVFLAVTASAGVVAALVARRDNDPDDGETIGTVVSIAGVDEDTSVPWDPADPFGRDWTGRPPA